MSGCAKSNGITADLLSPSQAKCNKVDPSPSTAMFTSKPGSCLISSATFFASPLSTAANMMHTPAKTRNVTPSGVFEKRKGKEGQGEEGKRRKEGKNFQPSQAATPLPGRDGGAIAAVHDPAARNHSANVLGCSFFSFAKGFWFREENKQTSSQKKQPPHAAKRNNRATKRLPGNNQT